MKLLAAAGVIAAVTVLAGWPLSSWIDRRLRAKTETRQAETELAVRRLRAARDEILALAREQVALLPRRVPGRPVDGEPLTRAELDAYAALMFAAQHPAAQEPVYRNRGDAA